MTIPLLCAACATGRVALDTAHSIRFNAGTNHGSKSLYPTTSAACELPR
jgi:hypothetical protein